MFLVKSTIVKSKKQFKANMDCSKKNPDSLLESSFKTASCK